MTGLGERLGGLTVVEPTAVRRIVVLTNGGAPVFNPGDPGSPSVALPRDLRADVLDLGTGLGSRPAPIEIRIGTQRLLAVRGTVLTFVADVSGPITRSLVVAMQDCLDEIERGRGDTIEVWFRDEGLRGVLRDRLRTLLSSRFGGDRLSPRFPRDASGRLRMKLKVVMVGDTGVRKTALIRRFVLDMFDDKYIQTLGTKVSKKALSIAGSDGRSGLDIDMTIWDVVGQKGFLELLKEAYFYGAGGIIAVCDIRRLDTLLGLENWIEGVFEVVGTIPVTILVDMPDMVYMPAFGEDEVRQVATRYSARYFFTSSVTGTNVEAALEALAESIGDRRVRPS